ncbi:penicillin acylase family protein, partial [Candidatus Bipolaricaulota bacterium]|nr:penicillin acylase family protein [Candidatus Bipolaricaulota bacterium]
VNAYIADRSPSELALEYRVLGLTGIDFDVAPWSPVDTLVFAKLMAWDMGLEESKDVLRGALYERIGPGMTDAWLTPPWPYDQRPTIVQPEDLPAAHSASVDGFGLTPSATGASGYGQQAWDAIGAALGTGPGGGTNAWVVSGEWTESGLPLLANDTHLGIQLPTVWYEIGLHCSEGVDPALDVVGFAFPASLGVVVGHNAKIAWAISNAFPDVHDVYRLRINPANPLQYEWNGTWRDMTVREETIEFGDGSELVTIHVRETHLGPITTDNRFDPAIGEVSGFNDDEALAQRWTALDPGTISRAVIALDQAGDWDAFRTALRDWDVPAQHFVYADVTGSIGYQLAGRVPIRAADFDGLVPTIGWTDEHEWKGFIPFELLPHVLNPTSGVIVAANHAAVPPAYYDLLAVELGEGFNYRLNGEIDYAYRAERIHELLASGVPHTVESFGPMQGDTKSLSAGEVLPYLAELAFEDAQLAEARDWLLEWDGRFDPSSARAVLYAHMWDNLVRNVFADELGSDAQLVGGDREMWSIRCLLEEPENPWWDDTETDSVVETRDDVLLRSFTEAHATAVGRHGAQRAAWSWGGVHTATFVSKPLGQSGVGMFEALVNRGPIPVGGMTDTISNTRWNVSAGTFDVKSIPAMRMVIDVADLSRSVGIHSTGQSGHPFAKDYDSMLEGWRDIAAYPLLWTREEIENAVIDRLILRPLFSGLPDP